MVLLKEGRARKVEFILTSNRGNYITKCYTSIFEKTVIKAIDNIINGFNFGGGTFIKTFDPLCGSYKENKITKKLREGNKIYFNYL